MSGSIKKAAIVYCSPAGTTRHAANVIEQELKSHGIAVIISNLDKKSNGASVIEAFQNEKAYLFIGSPVYVNRPVPPVMSFISKLPKGANVLAIPFVTWGCVSSGIALHDMGKAIIDKDIRLAGAAKIPAAHSMMWRFDNPLGENHPNGEDDKKLRQLVKKVLEKGDSGKIPLSELAYQPPEVHAEMEIMTLAMAKSHMPKKEVVEQKCTECGICTEVCPTDAIQLSPFPTFIKENCITCFKCVKECPEEAIVADFSPLEERIRERAKQMNESPGVKFFV